MFNLLFQDIAKRLGLKNKKDEEKFICYIIANN